MAYTSGSFVFGEQPSASKFNTLWTNDASFNDGTGIFGLYKNLLAVDSNPYKFSAYASGNTSITNTTQKVVLNTEIFDTNNNFDSSTNYRYTAPVTGFYQLSAQVGLGSAGAQASEYGYLMIYKNNAELVRSEMIPGVGNATLLPRPHISILVSLTAGDYLELWCNYTGSRDIVGGSNISWFTGFLVSRT